MSHGSHPPRIRGTRPLSRRTHSDAVRADPGARPQHARQLRLARQAEYRLATGDEAVEAPTLAAYDDLARLMSALQDLAHMARRLNARQIARRSPALRTGPQRGLGHVERSGDCLEDVRLRDARQAG